MNNKVQWIVKSLKEIPDGFIRQMNAEHETGVVSGTIHSWRKNGWVRACVYQESVLGKRMVFVNVDDIKKHKERKEKNVETRQLLPFPIEDPDSYVSLELRVIRQKLEAMEEKISKLIQLWE